MLNITMYRKQPIIKNQFSLEDDQKKDTTGECFVDCLKHHCGVNDMLNVFNKNNHIVGKKFKKNYQVLSLENEKFVLYNEKYQALIDSNIYNFLTSFQLEDIKRYKELTKTLYGLGFLVDA